MIAVNFDFLSQNPLQRYFFGIHFTLAEKLQKSSTHNLLSDFFFSVRGTKKSTLVQKYGLNSRLFHESTVISGIVSKLEHHVGATSSSVQRDFLKNVTQGIVVIVEYI